MTRSEAITALYVLFNAPHNADINLVGLNVLLDELYLSPQPEQEPMAWMDKDGDVLSASVVSGKGLRNIPLYTTPPQIEVGCAECGVGNHHALYCVVCAEKFIGEAAIKLQQKQRRCLIGCISSCVFLLGVAVLLLEFGFDDLNKFC